jgi:hypothetical protein
MWSDTDKQKIESVLNGFVAKLYVAAARIKERRIARKEARPQDLAALLPAPSRAHARENLARPLRRW